MRCLARRCLAWPCLALPGLTLANRLEVGSGCGQRLGTALAHAPSSRAFPIWQVQRLHYEERLAEQERSHTRHLWEVEQEMQAREDALRRQHDAVDLT